MGQAKEAAKEAIRFGALGSALQLLARKAELQRELEDVDRKLNQLRKMWEAVQRNVDRNKGRK